MKARSHRAGCLPTQMLLTVNQKAWHLQGRAGPLPAEHPIPARGPREEAHRAKPWSQDLGWDGGPGMEDIGRMHAGDTQCHKVTVVNNRLGRKTANSGLEEFQPQKSCEQCTP